VNAIDIRTDAEATLRAIARRQLHRAWKIDPSLPGSTLSLSAHDEARVIEWLRDTHNVDLEHHPLHDNGHPFSARCIDRLRWGAALSLTGRLDAEGGRRRVVVALRDDLKWWAKHHGAVTP
jgi:hypothetical protein